MIRELQNLKCRAIAVDVPKGYRPLLAIAPTAGNEMIYLESNGTINATAHCYLPAGEWTILGRADELKVIQIEVLTRKTSYDGAAYKFWLGYCAANSITNELILIETT